MIIWTVEKDALNGVLLHNVSAFLVVTRHPVLQAFFRYKMTILFPTISIVFWGYGLGRCVNGIDFRHFLKPA